MDLGDVRRLLAELQDFEHSVRASVKSAEQMGDAYLSYVMDRLADLGDTGTCVLAERGGKIIGLAIAAVEDDILETASRHVHVHDLVVSGSVRGQGVGRQLIDAIEQFARGLGVNRISTSALAANERAATAYRKLGFQPVEVTFERWIAPT